MPDVTDQTGRSVFLSQFPQRIVSLVPSQTELLFDLGLDEKVVGITKFCIHPAEWFRTKTRVGGTKQVKMDVLHSLQPDLVIANKEENVKEQVEEIASHYPVWISDINNLEDAYDMIDKVGSITGTDNTAQAIIRQITQGFATDHRRATIRKAIYLIWNNPFMTVGGDTFINNMMEVAGFQNSFSDMTRYPAITIDDIRAHNPNLLLLSSEPFPFKQKHVEELQALLPTTKIMLVDGEMFSWYGSRLVRAAEYFNKLR